MKKREVNGGSLKITQTRELSMDWRDNRQSLDVQTINMAQDFYQGQVWFQNYIVHIAFLNFPGISHVCLHCDGLLQVR